MDPSTSSALASDYTFWQMFWYLGGFLLWGIAYAVVLVKIHKHKFVEIPAIAVCGNVTWEFLWGFVWEVDMFGGTLQWFYRLGCLMDMYILYSLFKYGHKQLQLEITKRFFKPILVFALLSWTGFYWTFVHQGYDLPLGSNTAYLVNLVMSTVYIGLILRMSDVSGFSVAAGWLKGLGTGMVTVFCFLTYPDNLFVQTLGCVCAVLDLTYMYTLHMRQAGKWAPQLLSGGTPKLPEAALAS